MMKRRDFFTAETKNILLLSLMALVLGLQVMFYGGALLGLIHFKPLIINGLLQEWGNLLKPKMDAWYWLIFITASVGIQVGLLKFFRLRLKEEALFSQLMPFCIVELIFVMFFICASWKLIIYDDRPQLARMAFNILLVLSLVNKIFWPEILKAGKAFGVFIFDPKNQILLQKWLDPLFLIFIWLIIYLPDPQAALAKMFVGEQYHHFDSVVMAVVWAVTSGNQMYVDNTSEYGLGLPILLGQIAQTMGGCSYEHVFVAIMWICIIYYLLLYLLLRYWYQDILIAMSAILTALKVQLFFSFSYPMTFTYPNGTVLRSCFDIFFMMAILMHLKTRRPIFLLSASAITGLSIFYIFTTGIDMTFALYAYLILHLSSPHYRQYIYRSIKDMPLLLGYFGLGIIISLVLMHAAVGQHLWSREFWANVVDFPYLASMGLFRELYFRGLETGYFWDVLIGGLFPIVYAVSVIFIGIQFYFGRGKYRDIFIVVLSVYGLSMYHHYANQAVGNNYYMRAVPFVVVVFHWVNELLAVCPQHHRRWYSLSLLGFSAFCLLTNHNFIAHPNLLNFSRNPYTDSLVARPLPGGIPYYHHRFSGLTEDFKLPVNSFGQRDEQLIYRADYFKNDEELKNYWHSEFDFTRDAAFIDRLTSPNEKVPLLSSFETKILMQAKRRPYFYFFPLLESRPMYMRTFSHTNIFIKKHLKLVLDNFEKDKPKFIFMERIYLNRQWPQRYELDLEELLPVIKYIQEHYEPYDYGYYLVAMRRKEQLNQ